MSAAALRVYVSGDAAARALGADAVAQGIASRAGTAGRNLQIVRTGSRGLVWAEPLVEVDTNEGRIAYGPVQTRDLDALFGARFLEGGAHALRLGKLELLPWFARQERLTFAYSGYCDPLDYDAWCAAGGLAGVERALGMSPAAIVQAVGDSGLRGRGGAAFPTGRKWQTVADQAAAEKFIVCNADEGDSGTFSDRMLMEGDPFTLLAGMTIAGLAVGATRGYIYLRIEYPHARRALDHALQVARARGLLGPRVLGSAHSFDIELRLGAGAYICGEETSLLESLEGKRAEVRFRPPLPAIKGLWGQPTVVNNVITLASVPVILARGAAYYRDFGAGDSRGTLPLQLAGNVRRGGLIEKAFGVSLRELVEDFGGGTLSGRPVQAVQVGGPLGAYLTAAQLDTPLTYEGLAGIDAMLGHGGVVVFDDSTDMLEMARFAMEFCAHESCGKCTPCRIGSTRAAELLDRLCAGRATRAELAQLESLCETMISGSLCGLGGMAPFPVRSILRGFADSVARRLV
ncbi:MAG: formate dehydrogenase [Gammaproteobacteria bacterium]|nr:formate dehydrogenase [Gammaproteobacteria bacterium]